MENPLFNASVFSPSPVQGTVRNPVWSTGATAGLEAPSSAVGLRRLSDMQPWELPLRDPAVPPAYPPTSAATAAAAAMGRDRPEEAQFADILRTVMAGDLSPADALTTYAGVCRARATELRDLAQSHLHRAPRYLSLSEAAAEMDAEAATWELVWHLHGIPGRDFPAGCGGDFVEGAGFAKTYRQLAADVLFQDDTLNRAARAVTWLEALAASADPEPEQGLARKDGVWQETKARLSAGPGARALSVGSSTQRGTGSVLVDHLDPDATTRTERRLDTDNAKDEERLARTMWRLFRSGRVARAAAACEYAGQSWRAVSFTAAGEHGPLPLGAAAEEADAFDAGQHQAETLASEIDIGPLAMRGMWRWACFHAAERIAATASATGAGVHESGVYGILASYLPRVLPACSSWEDSMWAHLRCWLECTVDASLARCSTSSEQQALHHHQLGEHSSLVSNVWSVSPEAILGSDGGDASKSAMAAQCMGAAAPGGWPVSRVRDALPRTLEEAAEAGFAEGKSKSAAAGAGSGGGGGGGAVTIGTQRFHRMQLDLILNRVEPLIRDALVGWIINGADVAETAALPHDTAAAPPCPPGLMRFAAHFALSMWALGVASLPDDPDPSAAYSQLHDLLQRLVQVYAVHLIDSGAHALVPQYACHLRAGLRRPTLLLLFEQLLAKGDVEVCRAAHRSAHEWVVTHGAGDAEENEMGLIARKFLAKAQTESIGGPMARARALLWLLFEADGAARADAVRWACVLCREFCLSGPGGAAAAEYMLAEVVPAGLGITDVMKALETLLSDAREAGAGVEAEEIQGWTQYFELESEFASWEQVYVTAVEEARSSGQDPSGGALEELARETLPLLDAAEGVLTRSAVGWLIHATEEEEEEEVGIGGGRTSGPAAPPPGEIAMVVGPSMEDGPAAVLEGHEYLRFTPEEQSAAAELLSRSLGKEAVAAAGAGGCVSFVAGPAPDDGSVHLSGLISIAADCGRVDDAARQAAVAVLAPVLKGSCTELGNLVATNVSAAPVASGMLCRAVVLPRMALKVAALRRAIAFMGQDFGSVAELSQMVAELGIEELFTEEEMAELREYEGATMTLLKKIRKGRE